MGGIADIRRFWVSAAQKQQVLLRLPFSPRVTEREAWCEHLNKSSLLLSVALRVKAMCTFLEFPPVRLADVKKDMKDSCLFEKFKVMFWTKLVKMNYLTLRCKDWKFGDFFFFLEHKAKTTVTADGWDKWLQLRHVKQNKFVGWTLRSGQISLAGYDFWFSFFTF